MRFLDEVIITVCSGDGGAGASSFRREKFVTEGGPDGGDGGDGGSVYFRAENSFNTLYHLRGKRFYKAEHGVHGKGRRMTGRRGQDIDVIVPVGTLIKNQKTGEILADLVNTDQRIKIAQGGKGGLGNWHFKNSINQVPTYSQKGLPGEELKLALELKSVADVGIVGFPNAGKSTFISVVSRAKPEIADYPFTTLIPNLGVVSVEQFDTFVIADIPGIIEGAHEGTGLGLKFLKHIERTKVFLHMIEFNSEEPIEALRERYDIINRELLQYDATLGDRPHVIAISKLDMIDDDDDYDRVKALFSDITSEIYFISSPLHEGTQKLVYALYDRVKKLRAAETK